MAPARWGLLPPLAGIASAPIPLPAPYPLHESTLQPDCQATICCKAWLPAAIAASDCCRQRSQHAGKLRHDPHLYVLAAGDPPLEPGCRLLRRLALLQSTLMRSIASGKLDGFPPKEVLKTVYVEHDIDASAAETAVVDFVMRDPMLEGATGLPTPPLLSCCDRYLAPLRDGAIQQTVDT